MQTDPKRLFPEATAPQSSAERDVWTESSLGPRHKWPHLLQTHYDCILSLSHPACIFWGNELVLLQNKFWRRIMNCGDSTQGQPQNKTLSKRTVAALHTLLNKQISRRLTHDELLRPPSKASDENYLVLTSAILEPDTDECKGTVAYLLPEKLDLEKPFSEKSKTENGQLAGAPESFANICLGTTTGEPADNVALDEHPFFHRFAEMLPTGLAILNHKAEAVFVNQHFYRLTTHRSDDKSFRSWPQTIHQDDYRRVMDAYKEAFENQTQLRTEFRAQGMNNPWRLLLLTPLGDDNLQHVSLREYGGFICSIVDITSEKSAEISQRKAAHEARERKEQQERFIDMISHEIRNPLSAILHCSEDIMDAVRGRQKDRENIDIPLIIEASDTITLCVTHQRVIVDDVLSFSKLDASMLSLSPRIVQPKLHLSNPLKMFHPELKKHNLEFEYNVDYSYDDCEIDWVMADLARISQVLINLMSNSIKFTSRKKGEKKISVSVGASLQRPTSYPPNVVFFDPDDKIYRLDATASSEWGNGEAVYVMVAVRDTGIGITPEGQKRLFERFRQATPKTEEIYGGSGLGLNISRKICHLHGGEIGVSSKDGVGSTFGFFFRVRRSDPPGTLRCDRNDGSSDEDLHTAEQEEQIRRLGHKSPEDLGDQDSDDQYELRTIEDPPTTSVAEVSPNATTDDRWNESAEIAAGITQDSRKAKMLKEVSNERESKVRNGSPVPDQANDQAKRARRPHILLAEDNIINQRVLKRKLESKGFSVKTANNGREAFSAIKDLSENPDPEKLYDCILMDQEMPVMDGNAATRSIRDLEASHSLNHTPILGVTANVREEQREDMIEAGMDDVIHKPYRVDEMVAKINQLLKLKQKSLSSKEEGSKKTTKKKTDDSKKDNKDVS